MGTKTTRFLATPLMALALVSSGLGFPVNNVSAFGAVGRQVSTVADPVNGLSPTTGFPLWYQDTSGAGGEKLQLCLGTNADGVGPVDPKCILPGQPSPIDPVTAVGTNFPDESFYWFAEAPLTVNGQAARFRMALEAAFATGAVAIDGQQITFARASLFTSQDGVFPANSSFHVVYPFGAFDFTTDGAGAMVASNPNPLIAPFQPNGGGAKELRAEDGPGAAGDFTTVLAGTSTGITNFLKSSVAPAGYLGDGVTEAPVTGGTNGNVVTITQTAGVGPFTVVGGTNWIVAGRLFAPKIVEKTPVATLTNNPVYVFTSNDTGTISYGGACATTTATTTAVAGDNTITFSGLADGLKSDCTVTVTNVNLHASNVLTLTPFTIDATAPVVTEVTPVPLTALNNTPSYTFNSTEAGTVTYGGSCSSSTTSATTGNNTIVFNPLASGLRNDCTITITDAATNVSNALAVTPFTVNPWNKIAVYDGKGKWFLDMNGNGAWNGPVSDRASSFGFAGTTAVAGDWNGSGISKIGVYDGKGTWHLDVNSNGVWDGPVTDKTTTFGFLGAVPVTGDWDGNGTSKIGVYDGKGKWYLDINGNGVWDGPVTDKTTTFGFLGAVPVTGDWDGSGTSKIGIYDGKGTWYLDVNGNGVWDGIVTDKKSTFGFSGATPVVGDWNGSNAAKIAVYDGKGKWYLDINGNGVWDGPVTDKTTTFGFAGAVALSGIWN